MDTQEKVYYGYNKLIGGFVRILSAKSMYIILTYWHLFFNILVSVCLLSNATLLVYISGGNLDVQEGSGDTLINKPKLNRLIGINYNTARIVYGVASVSIIFHVIWLIAGFVFIQCRRSVYNTLINVCLTVFYLGLLIPVAVTGYDRVSGFENNLKLLNMTQQNNYTLAMDKNIVFHHVQFDSITMGYNLIWVSLSIACLKGLYNNKYNKFVFWYAMSYLIRSMLLVCVLMTLISKVNTVYLSNFIMLAAAELIISSIVCSHYYSYYVAMEDEKQKRIIICTVSKSIQNV